MLERQTTGSVVCPSCGKLVGVSEEECWHCGRRNPGMWGYAQLLRRLGGDVGIADVVMWGCGALYLISLLIDSSGVRMGGAMSFLSPSHRSLEVLGSSGAVPVIVRGHWWTLLSAGWLHGGLLHILFNMLWVRQLAPATTMIYGPGRTTLIYVLSSIAGFALSSFGGAYLPLPLMGRAYFTVGASAAIFGLLGAMVYAGRRGVAMHLGRQAWIYAMVLFVFGLAFPGVDNWAHLGGFLGGFLLAKWFNPLTREKADHVIGGLVALAATAIAIGLAVVSGLSSGG